MSVEFVAEYSDIPPTEEEVEAKKVIEQEAAQEVSEGDPEEEKARASGWLPKDEWEGDPDKWVEPKEYNFRGELFTKIKSQSKASKNQDKRIAQLETALKALGEHNKKIAEKEYEKAYATLKRQKANALDDADHDTVVEIDEQMTELKAAKTKSDDEVAPQYDTQPDQIETPEPVQEWMDDPRNDWYSKDPIMRGAANALAAEYSQEHFGESPNPSDKDFANMFDHIEKTIKGRFPKEFENPRKNQATVAEPSARHGATPTKRSSTKLKASDLSPEQRGIMKTFVDQGIMTEAEYLADLEQIGIE